MRWNQTKAADLLSSGRAVLSDIAARRGYADPCQHMSPRGQPLRRASHGAPAEKERLVDDWLTCASQPMRGARPTTPDDFTARVMARLEAGPVVAPRPITPAKSRPTIIEHLCLVSGVFGVSILLIVATCLVTALLAPNVIFTVLNALVAAFVAICMLLVPLLDALGALVANPTIMCALLVLVAGALALWSRVLYPAARLTGEA